MIMYLNITSVVARHKEFVESVYSTGCTLKASERITNENHLNFVTGCHIAVNILTILCT